MVLLESEDKIEIKVSRYLDKRYLEWQLESGEIRSKKEFAEYLDVRESTLGHWMNGRRIPNYDFATILAEKLSAEVYAVCGYLPPDPFLQTFIVAWYGFNPIEKKEIQSFIEELK